MQFNDYYEDQSILPEHILSYNKSFNFVSEHKRQLLVNCKENKKKNIDCQG